MNTFSSFLQELNLTFCGWILLNATCYGQLDSEPYVQNSSPPIFSYDELVRLSEADEEPDIRRNCS